MGDCIFCSIVNGNIPSEKVYENEHVFAFRDINPEAPVHIVIIPKKHIATIMDVDTSSNISNELIKAAQHIAEKEGIEKSGFRLVNNCNEEGGQTVYHLHVHLLGGRNMKWPPG